MVPKKKKNRNAKRLHLFILLKQSFAELKQNDPLRMAGATAFFTTFALPSILIILIQIFGLFLTPEFIGSGLTQRLTETLGKDVSDPIIKTLRGISNLAQNWYITIGGFVFLMFVATTLFNIIKNSFNQIWQIKIESHPGILFYLKMRGRSL